MRKLAIGFAALGVLAAAVVISHVNCAFGCAQFGGDGVFVRNSFGGNGMMSWHTYQFAFGGDVIASLVVLALIVVIFWKQRSKRAARVWEDE